jgi:hypothetical protein
VNGRSTQRNQSVLHASFKRCSNLGDWIE